MLIIPKQHTSLEFTRPITWDDIFDIWRNNEARQEFWKKQWQERGFDSWDEWRIAYSAPLSPEKLKWNLYEIKNPLEEFPLIYGVPADAWIKNAYNGEKTKKLKDILDLPIIKDNQKISDIAKDFPEETVFAGIIHKDKIVLIEGMHRACALADWNKNKQLNSEITIALANWDKKEIPKIGGNYKK